MNKIRNLTICTLSIVALLFLDQITKYLALKYLAGQGVVSIIGDYAILVFAQNRGAFLSLGNNLGDVFWYVTMVAMPIALLVGFTGYILWKKLEDGYFLLLWVLILSGGLGNIIDRVSAGKVIDFMNFGIGDHFRTGILNVADIYITAAVIIVLIKSLFQKENKDKPAS